MKSIQCCTALLLGLALAGCATGTKVTSHTEKNVETQYSEAIGVPFLGMIPAGSTTTSQNKLSLPASKTVATQSDTTVVATTQRPVNPGQLAKDVPLEIEPIFFDTNRAILVGKSADSVATLAKWLKSHPKAKVTIEGHTDSTGTVAQNKALGAKRAEAVRQALRKSGIAAKRIAVLNRGGDATERRATATIAIN